MNNTTKKSAHVIFSYTKQQTGALEFSKETLQKLYALDVVIKKRVFDRGIIIKEDTIMIVGDHEPFVFLCGGKPNSVWREVLTFRNCGRKDIFTAVFCVYYLLIEEGYIKEVTQINQLDREYQELMINAQGILLEEI